MDTVVKSRTAFSKASMLGSMASWDSSCNITTTKLHIMSLQSCAWPYNAKTVVVPRQTKCMKIMPRA